MRALLVAGLLLGSTACGTAASLRAGGDYRSRESYGTAHWGMTPDELQNVVSELVPCGPGRLCRDEQLKGLLAHVRYELVRQHLARVEIEVPSASPGSDFSSLERDLTRAYGSPRRAAPSAPRRSAEQEVMEDLGDLARLFGGQPTSGTPISSGVRSLVLGAAPPGHFSASASWTTPESALELRGSDRVVELRMSSRALVPAG
jgi:hypothetical protein